jgi:hypothetical protein
MHPLPDGGGAAQLGARDADRLRRGKPAPLVFARRFLEEVRYLVADVVVAAFTGKEDEPAPGGRRRHEVV